jgi:hypothetical protein
VKSVGRATGAFNYHKARATATAAICVRISELIRIGEEGAVQRNLNDTPLRGQGDCAAGVIVD